MTAKNERLGGIHCFKYSTNFNRIFLEDCTSMFHENQEFKFFWEPAVLDFTVKWTLKIA